MRPRSRSSGEPNKTRRHKTATLKRRHGPKAVHRPSARRCAIQPRRFIWRSKVVKKCKKSLAHTTTSIKRIVEALEPERVIPPATSIILDERSQVFQLAVFIL